MRRQQILKWWGSLLLAGILLTGLVLPYSSGPFSLSRSVFGGSSAVSSGATFVQQGTAGQPDWMWSCGGDFRLHSGFWHPRSERAIYLPLVIAE